ncbi:hypothetical protein [Aminicella lysinilytica]|jgi:membrane-associated HD superfamily phosphohydrolase|uniref:Uncharacterized protein n=1 Tax=Aminicella lysinilytica TaxID=433323 RepID=A0A4R6Q2M5_9FIRM|nr:hypothetical protein [Aminicella lysinilytica]TDP56441.1 hypothetical protein EV211_11415 [Aminicella lysinilytica]
MRKNREKEIIQVSAKDFRTEQILRIALLLEFIVAIFVIIDVIADMKWSVSDNKGLCMIIIVLAVVGIFCVIGLLYIRHIIKIVQPWQKIKREITGVALGSALNLVSFILVIFMPHSAEGTQQTTIDIIMIICLALAATLYQYGVDSIRSKFDFEIDNQQVWK